MTGATSRKLRDLRSAQPRPCLRYLGLALVLAACGGVSSVREPRDARAAGGLPSYRPVPLREFAYRVAGSHKGALGVRSDSFGAELEAFLGPTAPRSKVHTSRAVSGARALGEATRPRMGKRPVQAMLVVPNATASLSQPEREVAPVQRVSPQEVRNYAAREARSQAQQQYRGGNAVVITASTLVIILLVVLLIVLLIR